MRLTLSLLLLSNPALLLAAEIGKTSGVPSIGQLPTAAIPKLETPAIPGAAAPLTPLTPQTAAGEQVQNMSQGVGAVLDAAGPMAQASEGDAAAAGENVQKALEGGAVPAAPVVADPVFVPAAPKALTSDQAHMLRALKFVVSLYTEHYAPRFWKQQGRDSDFLKNYQVIREEIIARPDMTQREFRKRLLGFVERTQDFHASISFYSTEASKLPVTILGAEGRYFIFDVAVGAAVPVKVGDEVLEFDGKPVAEAVAALQGVQNTPETDSRLAQMQLTGRSGRKVMDVPQGQAKLKVKKADGSVEDVALDWQYTPEMIPQEVPPNGDVLGPENIDPTQLDMPAPLRQGPTGALQSLKQLIRSFIPPMAHPDVTALTEAAAEPAAHGFTIGSKKSFVPELGKIIFPATPQEKAKFDQLPFHAYIYENEQGQKIGYIRIPDYMAGGQPQQMAQLFAQFVAMFEKKTDALVLDQVNNPGGNMFYMYTLLSMLTEKPLALPQHFMMLDQSDGKLATEILKQAEKPSMEELVKKALSDEMMGFQVVPSAENPIIKFAKYILNRLKRAQDEKNPALRLTELIDLFGVSQIDPQPMVHYTKPIVVLINELDFSAADFLPAVLKDNGRATLFGVRTAGAGGAVKSLQWPNQFGIEQVSYTWTLAMRTIGKVIENLGVAPDVQYAPTAADMQNGFQGYKKALNDTVRALIVSRNLTQQP